MTVQALVKFASTLEGERLETGVQRAGFRVSVSGSGIAVTPESTGRTRAIPRSSIERFLEEYGRVRSTKAGDYQQVSFDASYLLAIIHRHEKAS